MKKQKINQPTIKISMFGGSGCGKTSYFASLYNTLKNNSINNFWIDSNFETITILDNFWNIISNPNSDDWPQGTRKTTDFEFDCYIKVIGDKLRKRRNCQGWYL